MPPLNELLMLVVSKAPLATLTGLTDKRKPLVIDSVPWLTSVAPE